MARVQFNLLPDIKQQSIKAQRGRNLVVSGAILASLIAGAIFLLTFFTVAVVQKKQLSDADKKIATANAKLEDVKGLDQMLSVQNQLQRLVGLHQNKHSSSRIFTYLPQITPTNVSIGRLMLNFKDSTMQIDGTADSQRSVNIFIDTLKFTTFTVADKNAPKSAFSSVVETSFSIGATSVSYSLTLTFDPSLFSNQVTDSDGKTIIPSLSVPNLTTTRSSVDDPSNFFNGQVGNPSGGGQ